MSGNTKNTLDDADSADLHDSNKKCAIEHIMALKCMWHNFGDVKKCKAELNQLVKCKEKLDRELLAK